MRIYLAISLITMLLIACGGSEFKLAEGSTLEQISTADFRQKLIASPDAQVVDARMEEEYRRGHLAGATLLNVFDPAVSEVIGKLDKSKPLFLYSQSGDRSHNAAKSLSSRGFKEIYEMKGGYVDWRQQGFETVK